MTNFFTTAKYRSYNRRDQRHKLPSLSLKIGSREFTTYDWSLGGFRVDDFAGRPPVGEKVKISCMSYAGDSANEVNVVAVVVRILLGKKQVAFSFNKLDDTAFELLESASMHRLALLSAK